MRTDFWSLASEPVQSKAGSAQENPFPGKLEIVRRVFCGGRGEDFFVVVLFLFKKKKKETHKDKYLLGAKCSARHLCFQSGYGSVLAWKKATIQLWAGSGD